MHPQTKLATRVSIIWICAVKCTIDCALKLIYIWLLIVVYHNRYFDHNYMYTSAVQLGEFLQLFERRSSVY